MTYEEARKEESDKTSGGIEIPLAALSGCSFGISGIFTKIFTEIDPLGLLLSGEWTTILTTISFWAMGISGAAGLIFWFWALSEGRIAVVGPFMSGFLIMIPVIAGLVYFEEPLTLVKGIGILIITLSALILSGRG